MGAYLSDLQGHAAPHVFFFELTSNGQVGMSHKPWHSSACDFQGSTADPTQPVLLFPRGYPVGPPSVLQPHEIEAEYLKDIEKLHAWMSPANIEWWNAFLEDRVPPV